MRLRLSAGLGFIAEWGDCWAGTAISGSAAGNLRVWDGAPCHTPLGCPVDMRIDGGIDRPGRMWQRTNELWLVLLSEGCVSEAGCAAQTARPTEYSALSTDPRLETITLQRELPTPTYTLTDGATMASVLRGFGISAVSVELEGDRRSFAVVKAAPLGAAPADGTSSGGVVSSVAADGSSDGVVAADATMIVVFTVEGAPTAAAIELAIASGNQGPVCRDSYPISANTTI